MSEYKKFNLKGQNIKTLEVMPILAIRSSTTSPQSNGKHGFQTWAGYRQTDTATESSQWANSVKITFAALFLTFQKLEEISVLLKTLYARNRYFY